MAFSMGTSKPSRALTIVPSRGTVRNEVSDTLTPALDKALLSSLRRRVLGSLWPRYGIPYRPYGTCYVLQHTKG